MFLGYKVFMLSMFFFILGTILGSFVNVVIERSHFDQNWVTDRSKCIKCKHTLGFWDLIPIISFISLAGRCRYCKAQLSKQYLIMELFGGVLTLSTLCLFEFEIIKTVLFLPILFLILILFVSDLKYMEIPDYFSIPLMLCILVFNYYYGLLSLLNYLIAGIIGGFFFLLLFLFTKQKGIGDGDIRLGMVMGFLIGFPDVITAIFMSFIIGSIFAIVLLVTKKANRKTALPLGVFLLPVVLLFFFYSMELNALPFVGVYNDLYTTVLLMI